MLRTKTKIKNLRRMNKRKNKHKKIHLKKKAQRFRKKRIRRIQSQIRKRSKKRLMPKKIWKIYLIRPLKKQLKKKMLKSKQISMPKKTIYNWKRRI